MNAFRVALLLSVLPLAVMAGDKPLTVESKASIQLPVHRATAAYAVDPQIADATVRNNIATIVGRSPGTTRVVIVTMIDQQVHTVIVTPRVNPSIGRSSESSANGSVGASWSSASNELQTSVQLRGGSASRQTELRVENVTATRRTTARDRISTPSASYTVTTGSRSFTILDQNAHVSPLTIDRLGIRGVHYDDPKWSLHGGVTSYAAFRSFLVPTERQYVASASRRLSLFGGTVVPTLVAVDARDGRGIRSLLSVAAGWRAADDFDASVELAYGGRIAGAAELSLRRGTHEFSADALYRPMGTTSVGPATNHGTFVNVAWATRRGPLDATVRGSLSRYDELYSKQAIDSLTADVRYRISRGATLIGGASAGRFSSSVPVHSYSIPAGIELRGRRSSLLFLPRYSYNSASNEGGLGIRVAGRTTLGRFATNAYIDVQQYAPTLDVIYREQPELQVALAELGISATTPGDIARALRENATLARLGFVEDVSIELAPSRTLAGWEAVWSGRSAARRQLRFRTFLSSVEGVARDYRTIGATLSWSQRITSDLDLYAAVSDLRILRSGSPREDIPSVQVGFRKTFEDGLSFDVRAGSIAGTVFLDENITGDLTRGTPLAGAEVSLDDGTSTVTKADGRYVFKGIRKSSHRVTVRMPSMPDAYFTTPSTATAGRNETVNFGVSRSPARLFGRVGSDAGRGVGDVRLTLRSNGRELVATTDSSGVFRFAVPPGTWTLELQVESLPPGYVLEGEGVRSLQLDTTRPAEMNLKVRANRSISGKVLNVSAPATISVSPGGRTITTAPDGSYSLRGLPHGTVTLHAVSSSGSWTKSFELSDEPSITRSADFGDSTIERAAAVTIASGAPAMSDGAVVVIQLGAFRVASNARAAIVKAQAAGFDPQVIRSGSLTTLRVGPFASAGAANDTLSRLHRAGIEAVVVRVR